MPHLDRRHFLAGSAAGAAVLLMVPPSRAEAITYVDVTSHGADPTGASDSTAAINAADAAARTAGSTLLFPAGTYSAYGLRPTCSWEGQPGSVIKNRAPASDKFSFVRISGRSGLSFTGLIFDGSVSADPATWDAVTHRQFTGGIACFAENSSNLSFTGCTFRNAARSGFRLHTCSDVTVANCTFEHVRDPWGDGCYTSGSQRVTFTDCIAQDHTRIGFVCDAAVGGNSDVTYQDCESSNGHDGSILYGGTEYNAGFWSENSTGTEFIDCSTSMNTHFGFNLQTGGSVPGTGAAVLAATRCTSTGCPEGFKSGSFGSRPINATFTQCDSVSGTAAAPIGYMLRLRYGADVVELVGCTSTIDAAVPGPTTAHIVLDDGATAAAGQLLVSGAELTWTAATSHPADLSVIGTSHASVTLTDVTTVPFGCVETTAAATSSPTITASGTTVLC